jgi:GGDEF domain-containing protein
MGDKVLRAVADRLVAGIRSADTACRYGGDEFVIMLPEVEDARIAGVMSEKLRRILSAPYVIDGCEIRMTASTGKVVYPYEGESPAELLDKADVASAIVEFETSCVRYRTENTWSSWIPSNYGQVVPLSSRTPSPGPTSRILRRWLSVDSKLTR